MSVEPRRRINRVKRHKKVDLAIPVEPPTETFAQRLVHARMKRGYTQKVLAEKVLFQPKDRGVRPLSRNAYSMYETGKTEPCFAIVAQLARALDVMPGWLAFGTGDTPVGAQNPEKSPAVPAKRRQSEIEVALLYEIVRRLPDSVQI